MPAGPLDFIRPKRLRRSVAESIDYVAFLWTLLGTIETKYQDETVRTIVSYNISVVEALLFYRAKRDMLKFVKRDFVEPYPLPEKYVRKHYHVVLAFRKEKALNIRNVRLQDLLSKQSEFLGEDLSRRIIEAQDVRNTIHLSKRRPRVGADMAESSNKIVLDLLEKLKAELAGQNTPTV